MFRVFSRTKHTAILIATLALVLINAAVFSNVVVGAVLLPVFLISSGSLIGPAVLPNRRRSAQMGTGVILMLCALSIVGSLIYYVGPAFQVFYILLVLVAGLSATLFGVHSDTESAESTEKPKAAFFASAAVILLCLSAWWAPILQISVTEAVRSPWNALDPLGLIAIALCVFLLALLLARPRGKALSLALAAAIFFSAVAVALAIYPIGFGFDPFIHRATVAHIAEHGTITPKPLYYIGQYALELLSVHAFALPLQLVDRLLVPLLATLVIGTSAAVGFSAVLERKYLPAMLAIFLLPLGAFIVTTPQSLAYVFTISLLFLSLARFGDEERKIPLLTLFVVALAAVFTHPLAGIPAAIYFTLVALFGFISRVPRPWGPRQRAASPRASTGEVMASAGPVAAFAIVTLLGAVSLPTVFLIQAKQSGLDISIALDQIFNLQKLGFTFFLDNRFSTAFDGLYLAADNLFWILLILAIAGVIFIEKNKGSRYLHLPLLAAVMWMVNYWLLSTALEFSFLIEYERQNYAVRLLTLASIFLVPHAGIALAGIAEALRKKQPALKISWALLLALVITGNVYAAYPRDDNYSRSAGFNVSSSDFDAVYAIENDARDDNFIVLANQAVSAAALEAFGFKKYYHGDIFYYPIPTGGELYQFYLQMADDEPTRDRALAAMDLAGVDTLYFAVNDYWWRSEVIIEHAKNEADEWFSVGEGAVTVFVYRR